MRRLLARFIDDSRAAVAVVFAATLPIAVAGAGFGVETTYWYYTRLKLQSAADAAAHSGALEKRSGSSSALIREAAVVTAADNGVSETDATITVNSPPTSGAYAGGDAVEVKIDTHLKRFFTALFNDDDVDIGVRSVARFNTAAGACILALSPSASRAAQFSGSALTKLTGCSVMANSVAADAINQQGSAKLTVDCLISAGGASTTNNLTLSECSAPITNAPPAGDPFADLPVPTATGCQNANGSVLQPGKYCNGLSLSGTVTLSPGVYIIDKKDFKVNANAVVTGDGVTIYLTGGARIAMNGNSQTNLSAPNSGTYAGMLFYGDRSVIGGRNTINGNDSSSMTGAIYIAGQAVDFLGNFSGLGGCTQVVANTIDWTGNSTVSADCSSRGMRTIPAYTLVQLVE